MEVSEFEIQEVMRILGVYFSAQENGTAASILPNPSHVWRFWRDGISLARMRQGIQEIDEYLNDPAQHGWAERNYPGGPVKFDSGPDLSRLPDNALVAMFQELDSVLAAESGSYGDHTKN
ncbi:MAG: hypothetical protein HYX82_02980 [Chloroflexi bacterium]|nr:hypothetical protein [Chloroflexota bacterium]